MLMSPFANSIRRSRPSSGSLMDRIGSIGGFASLFEPMPARPQTQGQISSASVQPLNPFEGNEQYKAMMDYEKSMQPKQEQIDRMNELRTAFEGTGGFKDYRTKQMERQMQGMGMGIGGQRPTGMGMLGRLPQRPPQRPQGIMGGFGMFRPQQPMNYSGLNKMVSQYGAMQRPQPMMNYSGYGMQRPQQNYGGYGGMQQNYGMQQPMNYSGYGQQPMQSPYQQYGMQGGGYQQSPYQQPYPQPQQYGGYGMNQNYGGQGGYSPMQNQYQPQQYGNNPNNFSGYGQQPAQQFY